MFQSRRKIVSLPSPTYASSAPDLLSSIMESQSMFHSKSSTMSVNRDGSIIVKVPRNTNTVKITNSDTKPSEEKAIDLRKPDQNVQTKSNPSYGSSGRGGNNWRGGRGDYHSGNNGNRSGRSYSGNTYHQGNNSGNYRDNGNYSGNDYNNSGSSFFNSNDSWMNNASRNQPPRDHYSNVHDRSSHQRSNNNNNRGRGTQPRYSPQVPRSRSFTPWQQQNYSDSSMPPNETTSESYSCDLDSNNASTTSNDESNYVIDRVNPDRVSENRPLGVYQVSDERINSTNNPTLPQPPIIRFEKPSLSDDEKAETGCAATEGDKYDPTEPTIDDSSSDNDVIVRPANAQNKITIISPPSANLSEKDSTSSTSSPSHPPDSLNLSDKALDNVVQQMLTDHEDLITACVLNDEKDDKDVESDIEAECPNFSIYSSASMDIAKNKEKSLDSEMEKNNDMVSEDLVQEDDADIIPDVEKLSSDFSSDSKLPTPEDHSIVQKILDKPSYEDDSQNVTQRGSLGLQSKFTPKRNLIKINLSSSFGSKKKIFGNENKPINLDANNDNSDYNPTISRMSLEEQINLTENKSPSHISADNFTESISDLEDERSYTPCLDENKSVKSKDTSLEDNDKGSTCIEGLETELISEDEGNELFSDPNRNEQNPVVEIRRRNLESSHHPEFEEGEIVEKNKQKIKEKVKELLEKSEDKISDDDRKKKRRDKKNDKEDKERNSKVKHKKESDNIFKKLSKSGKERNYRERDDKGKGKDKRRSKSTDKENRDKKDRMREKKKEKRKDMERYDVRNIISDKNRRMKDAFGRDKSRPRSNSPSSRLQSPFRYRRSASRRRSPSHSRRSTSRPNESPSKERRSKSPHKFPSNSRRKQSMPRGLRSLSKEHKSVSPNGKQSNSIKRRSITPKSLESSKKRISLSPRARSPMIRNKISISPRNRRSISPRNRRSISPRIRRSVSPRNRRSVSPRNRRSVSPRNRRSISPRIRRSISPRIRRSISPRNRRSISPRNRRSISPRMRRSKSRNKRSISRNRRSISRNRNKRIRRSVSRSRRISPKPHRNKSPRRRLSRRSRSKVRSISRNRSRSPKSKKLRKVKRARSDSNNRKSKSPIKSKVRRKRSRSFSPGVALSRSLSRDRLQSHWQEAEKSPLFQDWTSGSQSMSPTRLRSPGLTPPLMEKSPEPQNLRVILTTKEKTKKKDKKKKSNKRNKTTDRVLKPSKDIGPSKEVFTSGNNILVSVSFNKNKEMDNVSNMPVTEIISKKKKRKTDNPIKQKKEKKDKIKKKRLEKDKRCKEIENKKPVAIIDLDKSPFKELTPSPKAVIVLSDSDNGEKEEEIRERQEILREKTIDIGFPQPESESIPNSPSGENNYVSSTGPKTPPEPPIKFTIISKSNPQLRSVNPLHEDEDETIEAEEANPPEEPTTARACESSYIGPNTPPDPPNSPPSSPDAYDPFEPTKSGSATPERIPNTVTAQSEPEKIPEVRPDELLSIPCMSLEAAQKSNLSADDVIQAKPISPTEKVMALLKSTRASLSPSNPMQQIFSDSTYESTKVDTEVSSAVNLPNMLQSPDMNSSSTITNKVVQPQSTYSAVVKPNSPKPIYSTVAPTVMTSTPTYLNPSVPRISAFNMGGSPSTQKPVPVLSQKITLPSPTKSSPLKSQPPKLFSTKPSPIKSTPIKPMVSSKTLISKLPMPTIKPIPRNQKINKTPNKSGQNGNETMSVNMDIDSPYSPGSSDFGDLFEPPSDNGKHNASAPASFSQKSTNKFETFDALFSIKPSSKNTKSSATTKVSVRQIKKSKGAIYIFFNFCISK